MKKKLRALSLSIGFVYLLFGGLKLVPNLSPAESIGSETASMLCGGIIAPSICIILLAVLEVLIGLLLMSQRTLKVGVLLAFFHMIMTFTPFIFYPELTFGSADTLAPSLLGQYILKNIIIICALLVIYPTDTSRVNTSYTYS